MAQQTLFTNEVPTLGDVGEGVPVTVATTVTFAEDGTLDGIQVYMPGTVSGTFSGAAWEITADDDPAGAGTLLDVVAMPSPAASSWQQFMFVTPIPVTAGKAYRIGKRTTEGRYTATGAGFNGVGMTNGDISAPATGGTAGGFTPIFNGTFGSGVTAYPNSTFNGNKYFVGPVYTKAGAPEIHVTTGTGPSVSSASGVSAATHPTTGTAAAYGSASGAGTTTRRTTGTAVGIGSASGYAAAGTSAPKLLSRPRQGRIVARTQVIR